MKPIAYNASLKHEQLTPYVTDGLIFMCDGEWNAGKGKHEPDASIWKDLVTNECLTRIGSTMIGENFIAMQSNAHYEIPIRTAQRIYDAALAGATIEIIFSPVAMDNNVGCFCLRKSETATAEGDYSALSFRFNNNSNSNLGFAWFNKFSDLLQHHGYSGYDECICKITIRFTATTLDFRFQHDTNVLTMSFNDIATNPNAITSGRIGDDGLTNRAPCKIYNIRAYDHLLSDVEISANNNVDIQRFGIPPEN